MHQVIARNFATASENKIHSDDIAKRFGFTGALVPGVTVFGHLTWPLTEIWNSRWLERSWVTTRFIKPAYDGETISITHRATDTQMEVECRNAKDVLLATLECSLETRQPNIDPRATTTYPTTPSDRVPISWDTVIVDQPFASYVWKPDAAHNRDYAARVDDITPLFQTGVIHPHAILSQANQALVKRFIMPAWIHTGSEIRFRKLLRVGDEIKVRAVPMEKWERKGHHFIKLYIAFVVNDIVATEIYHTAIFKVAEK